ncbi:phospholipase [Streptomyces pathocidini]|uniref:phospholipase n=1 Tax=Streptomyces pathocidini TaxID=1650571 RepID=UPI003404C0DA
MNLRLAAPALALATVLGTAASATAAGVPVAPADKARVLASWTQASDNSYGLWAAARGNRAEWEGYGFDWSTDYCSGAPDIPFGFDFRQSCARHDFGYRNYKAAGGFAANKQRLDEAFFVDLRRVCNRTTTGSRALCESTAWMYYQAVRNFGGQGVGG